MHDAPPSATFDMPPRERNIALVIGVAALVLMGTLIAAFWKPAPPKVVVMSTGPVDGAYHAFGLKYKQVLARSGVQLVLRPSSGAVENLERLRQREGGVTLALVQGGIARPEEGHEIVSLGGMFYEPIWVFHRRGITVTGPTDMAGRKAAVGVPGSGTQFVARALLERLPDVRSRTTLLDIGGLAAAQALQTGEVDIALFIGAPESPAVQQLLNDPAIVLSSVKRAEAFTRRYPFLTRLDLPEGAADLGRNLPPADTTLVASTASLLAAEDTHPVIVDLLLGAAREIHGRGSIVSRPGLFPAAEAPEYPLSPDAERFYKNGPSVLQRYLPFWAVVWIQRLIFLGLPILAVGIPLLRTLPGLYRWGMRRRIYRWYGELAFIERAARQGQGDRDAQLRRLGEIEGRVSGLHVPRAFASEAYTLTMHVQMVRRLLHDPQRTAASGSQTSSV